MMRSRAWHMALMLIALAMCCACGPDEHQIALDTLVKENATEEKAIAALGDGVTIYARGTRSWEALQQFLAREPPSNYTRLREAVEKYPRILYYTTEWRMTWVFVDEQGIVRGYYLAAQ
jgi:hypothetical protein